jgi:predicted metal-dependent phosphoesterase TrpH
MKLDLHVHTKYSKCSILSVEKLVKIAKNMEIYPAVTDHNTIGGALEVKQNLPQAIVGEEILTDKGEILGLFLNEPIKRETAIDEAIDKVHEQGGVAGVPHCFDLVRFRSAMRFVPKRVDFVEVCNSRTVFGKFDDRAREFAIKNKLPMSAGSDAHTAMEYGNSWVEMDEFSSPKDFLKNLSKGKIFCKRSLPIVHPISMGSKIFRKGFKI